MPLPPGFPAPRSLAPPAPQGAAAFSSPASRSLWPDPISLDRLSPFTNFLLHVATPHNYGVIDESFPCTSWFPNPGMPSLASPTLPGNVAFDSRNNFAASAPNGLPGINCPALTYHCRRFIRYFTMPGTRVAVKVGGWSCLSAEPEFTAHSPAVRVGAANGSGTRRASREPIPTGGCIR